MRNKQATRTNELWETLETLTDDGEYKIQIHEGIGEGRRPDDRYDRWFGVLMPEEEEAKLEHYAHMRPVRQWLTPIVELLSPTPSEKARGIIGKTGRTVDIKGWLRPVGTCQAWFGEGTAVIWEAVLWRPLNKDFELMTRLWDFVEGWLQKRGVREFLTTDSDPEWMEDPRWYVEFFRSRGYQHVNGRPRAMRKEIK